MTSHRDITSHRHGIMLWFVCHEPAYVNGSGIPKIIVFFLNGDLDLRPMTLTFELVRDIVKVNPSAKFWVRT